jgi:hypothetical protein
MFRDQSPEASEVFGLESITAFHSHRIEPEFRFAIVALDVDVRRLVAIARVEKETEGSYAEDGRHATMLLPRRRTSNAGCSGGLRFEVLGFRRNHLHASVLNKLTTADRLQSHKPVVRLQLGAFFMTRFRSIAAILGVAALLSVGASPAAAQTAKKQKKNKAADAAPAAIVGTITKVADDGKTFTVTTFGGNKKQPPTTTEFKLNDKTSIEYVAIDQKDLQKLTQGYAVIVGFDPKDKETATVVKATRIADAGKKKKKTGA